MTVIAAFAAIRAAEHGAQTALMAPTEILAEQHYLNFVSWLDPLGIPVVLLTGSQTAAERKRAIAAIESGDHLAAGRMAHQGLINWMYLVGDRFDNLPLRR